MKRKASFSAPDAKQRKLAKGRDKDYRRHLSASAGQGSRKASTMSVGKKDAVSNASSAKRVSLTPAASPCRRSLSKEVSSTPAEGGTTTSVLPRRSSSGRAEKKVPETKRLRESIPDVVFMTGPISNLEWSEWTLVISRCIFQRYDIKHHFKWSKVFRGWFRSNCFEGAENIPAIYEVGVKYACYHHKMHVMYYRACGGTNKDKRLILYILNNKFVRDEVNRHVKNEFDIYIRRGISRRTENANTMDAVKAAADHLKSIDYAWRNPNSRKKRYREDISEADLMTGPIKTLHWSEWYLAISKHTPVGYDCNKLQKSPILGGCYIERNLFANDKEKDRPSIYEIGVRYTSLKRKIHVTYYRVDTGARRNKRIVPSILNNKMINEEVARLLNNNFDVYIRRGVSSEIFHRNRRSHIKTVAEHLNCFDYAWNPYSSRGHRKLMTD